MQQDERQASGNDEDINLTYFVELLPLGEENYEDYEAQTRRENIVHASNLLRTIGQEIDPALRNIHTNHFSGLCSFFASVTETVNDALTWLEKFSKEVQNKNYEKYECVLRGLLHYSVIGSYATLFSLLKIICELLDVATNPYVESIRKIKENLAMVKAQHKEVCILLKKAGDILMEMIVEDASDQRKAQQFDVIVKDAFACLEESKGYLKLAQTSTSELIKIMTNLKWFSRILRLGGWALTCYTLYNLKPSSLDKLQDVVSVDYMEIINKCFSDDHMDKVTFAALCATSLCGWISLYPSQAYDLLDNLNDLKKELESLEMELQNLQKRLVGKKEKIDGLKKTKTTL